MADKALCTIPDCGKPLLCKGLCQTHYQRIQKKGYRPPSKPCAVVGCDALALGRKYCLRHYKRSYNYGDPLAGSTERGAAKLFLHAAVSHADASCCLVWPYRRNAKGYGEANIAGQSTKLAHRIVCELAHGQPPSDVHEAAHLCGQGHSGCINPHHLAWKTPTENNRDKLLHGTWRHGEQVRAAKITPLDVLEIRRAAAAGEKQASLASSFGISQSQVSLIVSRRAWAWVEG